MKTPRTYSLAAAALVAGLTLAACGSDDAGSGSSGGGDSGKALDGVSITVGSKDFTENILLGEMLAQALANEGADVEQQDEPRRHRRSTARRCSAATSTSTPSTTAPAGPCTSAARTRARTREELLRRHRREGPRGQRHQVGRAARRSTTPTASPPTATSPRRRAASTSSAWPTTSRPTRTPRCAWRPSSPTVPTAWCCSRTPPATRCRSSQIKILDTGLIYTETANGACDFGEVFTTDGRITALNLELVEDPGVMILYNVSFTLQRRRLRGARRGLRRARRRDPRAARRGQDGRAQRARSTSTASAADKVAEDYLTEIGVL